jgi:ribosomal protein L24E
MSRLGFLFVINKGQVLWEGKMYLLEILSKAELFVEIDGKLYYRCQKCRKAVHGSYVVTEDGKTFHVECSPN